MVEETSLAATDAAKLRPVTDTMARMSLYQQTSIGIGLERCPYPDLKVLVDGVEETEIASS